MVFTKILKHELVLIYIIYLVKTHEMFMLSHILIISVSLNLSSKNKYYY